MYVRVVGRFLCFRAGLWSDSFTLLYPNVYSFHLLAHVVDGTRGLEKSPLVTLKSPKPEPYCRIVSIGSMVLWCLCTYVCSKC
jgi:hypothetical protein